MTRAESLASLLQATTGTFSPNAAGSASSAIQDLGPVAIGSPLATTVYLLPRDPRRLETFVAAVRMPGDAVFHQFLSEAQSVRRFAPTDAAIADGEQALRGAGFTNGGTSFVAPQFAGTLALMIEKLGHRVGQLDPLLYRLQATGAAPAVDITEEGNIWGYLAHAGYDQTTGLGRIDAEELYEDLKHFD